MPDPDETRRTLSQPQVSKKWGESFDSELTGTNTHLVQLPSGKRFLDSLSLLAEQTIIPEALTPEARVLDAGSSSGDLSAHIAGVCSRGEVLGFDFDPSMVAYAKKRFPPLAHLGLTFVQGDITDIGKVLKDSGKADSSFDTVFSNWVLHCIDADKHEQILDGAHSALKPGGLLAFSFPTAKVSRELFSAALDVACTDEWKSCRGIQIPDIPQYTEQQMGAMLRKHGFRPARVRMHTQDFSFPNQASLASWFQATWRSFVAPIDGEKKQKEFSVAVVKEANLLKGDDGSIALPVTVMDVTAIAIKK